MQFGAMARSSFLLARHPSDPERRVAVLGPANYVPEGETSSLGFRIESYEFEENGRAFNVGRVADLEADGLTMDEALATRARARERNRQELIEAILGVLPVATSLGDGNLANPSMTTAAVAEALGRDKTDGTTRRRLAELKEAGQVSQLNGGWVRCESNDHDEENQS